MNPQSMQKSAGQCPQAPGWALVLLCALALVVAGVSDAEAQRRKRRRPAPKPAPSAPVQPAAAADDAPRSGPTDPDPSQVDSALDSGDGDSDDGEQSGVNVRSKGQGTQVFDFTGMNLAGSERKPQLLYFLDRAHEELKRASLERRSFIPEMVRSVREEAL